MKMLTNIVQYLLNMMGTLLGMFTVSFAYDVLVDDVFVVYPLDLEK